MTDSETTDAATGARATGAVVPVVCPLCRGSARIGADGRLAVHGPRGGPRCRGSRTTIEDARLIAQVRGRGRD